MPSPYTGLDWTSQKTGEVHKPVLGNWGLRLGASMGLQNEPDIVCGLLDGSPFTLERIRKHSGNDDGKDLNLRPCSQILADHDDE